MWVSEVFSGVESGVWAWGVVVWCVALRGLWWTVLFGCAGAVVGHSEASRGGAASCRGLTAGLAAPVAQVAVASGVSRPGPAAGVPVLVLRALLVWRVECCGGVVVVEWVSGW